MFDALADRLQSALGGLDRRGRLDEESIQKAMREVRLALLEADVNFEVVKSFVGRVKERALGQDVLKGLDAGQQVVKIVHDELTELMGSGDSKLVFGRPPTVILLCGLQGSGKTTACAKLALHLRKTEKRSPGLVAADLQRPAAIDQLETLGKQIQVPVYRTDTQDAVEAARSGLERATAEGCDVVIVDTAGRLQIDEVLMDELARVRDAVKPMNVLLVVDAMTGQEAVNVAQAFQEKVAFDGVILSKLDGDARGGAALSVKAITGQADQVRLARREGRRARGVPSRPHGVADPRDGRRTDADREGRGCGRGRRPGGARAADDGRRVHVRRLPHELPDAPPDGAVEGDHEDDPGPREAARRARDRREADGAGRGDRSSR